MISPPKEMSWEVNLSAKWPWTHFIEGLHGQGPTAEETQGPSLAWGVSH